MSRIRDLRSAGANILAVYPGPEAEVQRYAEDFRQRRNTARELLLLLVSFVRNLFASDRIPVAEILRGDLSATC
jgi:hypothetical protein